MTDEGLAGFLKEMAGGEIEDAEGMEICGGKEVRFFRFRFCFI